MQLKNMKEFPVKKSICSASAEGQFGKSFSIPADVVLIQFNYPAKRDTVHTDFLTETGWPSSVPA